MEHTPWSIHFEEGRSFQGKVTSAWLIVNSEGEDILRLDARDGTQSLIEHIVRAVNNHAKLLGALEGLITWLETRPAGIHIEVVPEITAARAHIEEARK